MQFAQHILLYPYGNTEVILYNTHNSALILIEKAKVGVEERILNTASVNTEEQQTLLGFGFFNDVVGELRQTLRDRKYDGNLTISIELGTECNFRCSYCYQRDWYKMRPPDQPANYHTFLRSIMEYISSVHSTQGVSKLFVGFIGGEPLLYTDAIIDFYNNIKQFCKEEDIDEQFSIDTNGSILTRSILNQLSDVYFSITLSEEPDHNLHRIYADGSGSYSDIVNNIKTNMDIFQARGHSLSIRYNVNSVNALSLDKFVSSISWITEIDFSLSVTYTESHADFVNGLTEEEFLLWLSTDALRILVKHSIPVTFFPSGSMYQCCAYTPYSCKVFSNGTVGLCDSFDPRNSSLQLEDIVDDPNAINDTFSDSKTYDPCESDKCKHCSFILLCGGEYFCKTNPCIHSQFVENYVTFLVDNPSSQHLLLGT